MDTYVFFRVDTILHRAHLLRIVLSLTPHVHLYVHSLLGRVGDLDRRVQRITVPVQPVQEVGVTVLVSAAVRVEGVAFNKVLRLRLFNEAALLKDLQNIALRYQIILLLIVVQAK